eukprot:TRINITY_DN74747_c0_g1_i1.p1 TRINITY_DN74747_c0_g1~~TRINITY_DN74747_c0_g1_i1.p1  ORF type:complete len:201 (+),score=89.06 TRINITY_DN74747_c0_g1_i1:69-671(+)
MEQDKGSTEIIAEDKTPAVTVNPAEITDKAEAVENLTTTNSRSDPSTSSTEHLNHKSESSPDVLSVPQPRSRRGSRDVGPPKRDLMMEHKISKWIISILGENKGSSGPGDFGGWLEDGSVLAGMMTSLCFNSVPMELVTDTTGEMKLTPRERVTILIDQLHNYGVSDKLLFTPEDLLEKKNIPKVTRCLASCVDLARDDV